MSAGNAVQAAIIARIEALGLVDGIYDGPPARASFPYVVIDAGNEADWSHKSGKGRELLIAVTLWDDVPERLATIADAVERSVAALGGINGWSLASLVFLRRRTVRDVAGPWATALDFRARLLADAAI